MSVNGLPVGRDRSAKPSRMVATLLAAAALGAAPAESSRPQAGELDASHVWRVEGEDALLLVRGERMDEIRRDAREVVRAVNTVLAGVALRHGGPVRKGEVGPPRIRLVELRSGTARVEVLDADYLTQRMGTTGAWSWLAAATFTLTEIPGVEAVELLFEEGDHAAPGRYTRARFGEFGIRRE